MKNSIRLAVAALAIGGTIAATTAFALREQPNVQLNSPVYALTGFECSRILTPADIEKAEKYNSAYVSWNYQPLNGYSFIGKTAFGNSTAMYGSVIQLRSSGSDCGIVTNDTSLGLSSISVEWDPATTNGRTIQIYGRSTEDYTSPSNLYNNDTDLLGEIVYKKSTTLILDKKYVTYGLRSKSGALYLNSITFNWSSTLA